MPVIAQSISPSWQYRFARNASESAYPELWSGLVGAWVQALGPTGNTLFDVSLFKRNGTLSGTTPTSYWKNGNNPKVPGCMLSLPGDTDNGWTSEFPSSMQTAGTILVVIKFPAPFDDGQVWSMQGTGNNDNEIEIFTQTTVPDLWFRAHDGTTNVTGDMRTGALNTEQWYVFAAAYKVGDAEIYLDGKSQATSSPATLMSAISSTQYFGYRASTTSFQLVADYGAVLQWDRRLPSEMITVVSSDPLALFRLRRRRIWVVPPAPGGLDILDFERATYRGANRGVMRGVG